MKGERIYFNIVIGIGSLIVLLQAHGINVETFFVWGLIIFIYIVFFSDRWYDFMDKLRGINDKKRITTNS